MKADLRRVKTLEIFCRDCDKITNQNVLFGVRQKFTALGYEAEKPVLFDYIHYITLQCAGCKQISFLQRSTSDAWGDLDGELIAVDNIYPNDNVSNFLRTDEEMELPQPLSSLYGEVKKAFSNNSNILAGVGLRMLVEAVCIDRKITGRNLQEKIINLQKDGLIAVSEVPVLDKLRQLGNSSAHQIKAYSLGKLEYALDIINHVLRSIYVLPKINKRLEL